MKISTLFPSFLITQELAELKHPRVVVLTVSELELFGFFFLAAFTIIGGLRSEKLTYGSLLLTYLLDCKQLPGNLFQGHRNH